jgi:hypothetical protein
MTHTAIIEKIRTAIAGLPERDVLVALGVVLVERALAFERDDGTRGDREQVKDFVATLTGGMIDIARAH